MKLFLSLLFSTTLFLQLNAQSDEHNHDEHEHHHHEHKNEIGLALGPVYNSLENEWAPGIHLHYLRFINEKFAFGGGFETILDEHKHITAALAIAYSPLERLTFVYSPGLTSDALDFPEVRFTNHFEVSYEFSVGENLHLGPLAEVAAGQDDLHYMLGLHIGLGF